LTINHGEGGQLPLARTGPGTLVLSEDSRGLKVDAELDPDDPEARAVASKVRRGDVDSMSFAFRATDDDWSEDRSKRVIRSLTLHKGDVSFVSQPANESTSVALRRRASARKKAAVGSYRASVEARRERLRWPGERRAHPGADGRDGPWKIKTAGDVARAVREVELGRAKGPKEKQIMDYIRQRARELGVTVPKTDWSAARSPRCAAGRPHARG
jgi:HK97 family phage prohead protease